MTIDVEIDTEQWYWVYSADRGHGGSLEWIVERVAAALLSPTESTVPPEFAPVYIQGEDRTFADDRRLLVIRPVNAVALQPTPRLLESLQAEFKAEYSRNGVDIRIVPELRLSHLGPTNDVGFEDDEQYTWGLKAIGVPNSGTLTGAGVVVGVLDTGYGPHRDFSTEEDRFRTFSVFDDETDSADVDGHGTRVVGIIAGQKHDDLPRYGVAPGASIRVAKVMRETRSDTWEHELLTGLDWLAGEQCSIVNISLGASVEGKPYGPIFEEACVKYANRGILIVCAAGDDNHGPPYFPGFLDSVLSVGSVNNLRQVGGTTALGASIDLAAPGLHNMTSGATHSGVDFLSDTSAAAPFVSGVAALWSEYYRSAGMPLQVGDLRKVILDSAKTNPYVVLHESQQGKLGAGIVRAPNGNLPPGAALSRRLVHALTRPLSRGSSVRAPS